MRKLVVTEFVSLDGVMEDPGWTSKHFNDDIWRFKLNEMLASEAHLLGRRTYEEFAGAWPYRSGDEMSDYINVMRKYVVSTTLDTVEWNNSHLIKENVADEIRTLKQQSGKDLLVAGSAQLVTFLGQEDLVDEYRFMVFPVTLGSGKRLFEGDQQMNTLKLVGTRTFDTGVVVLTYEPARGNGESA